MSGEDMEVAGCVVLSSLEGEGSENGGTPAPILGDLTALPRLVGQERIGLVLVCMPAAMSEQAREVTKLLAPLGVPWRVLPTWSDQLAGRAGVTASAERPTAVALSSVTVDPLRLLDRVPAALDEEAIRATIGGKVVLITGAGGSIGSELARIVCRFAPSRLVLVERSENSLFEIDRQIARLHPGQARAAVLHDVADASRTLAVVMAQKPDVIFHAAAHKHVPMMEDHPAQAVENNFYGTRSIADAACKVGVGRFVMISSDKAVNPSSVMGATKRLAELYIQYLNSRCETRFCMVRFGNVLGSACSVLPIWSQQLAHGGPVTVTHPEMNRYFMTIPEAAGLVLQSAAISGTIVRESGEVFLLDMGQPIRILDMAQRFIRSQGLEPGADVAIEFTGIRPGEKLFEELAYAGEDMIPTPHQSVRIWRTTPPEAMGMRHIIAAMDRLRGHADGRGRHLWQDATHQDIHDALHAAIPEMVAPATDAGSPVAGAAGAANPDGGVPVLRLAQ